MSLATPRSRLAGKKTNPFDRAGFASRLIAWYARFRRDLPWRVPLDSEGSARPDPYHVLVSEAMLQQTQVATVVPYFGRFIERFPTVESLACASEQDVLRFWQGLGYYRRARNLRLAAIQITEDFGGVISSDVASLTKLPGVGRYTAGAIASLAYGTRAAILDGNVSRVLCRLFCIRDDTSSRETNEQLWTTAKAILPQRRVGQFNSGLMELGATVCTPRNPQCLLCPVRGHCQAAERGLQHLIPKPKTRSKSPVVRRNVYVIHWGRNVLVEQRPLEGRWASMWQFATVDSESDTIPDAARKLGTFSHALTHRQYMFTAFALDRAAFGATKLKERSSLTRRWVRLDRLSDYPIPKPHLRVAEMYVRLHD